jgi:hypothetical protein
MGLEVDSFGEKFLSIASRRARHMVTPQPGPLKIELHSVVASIDMPWQCIARSLPGTVCRWCPHSWLTDESGINEQRRSQLAASVWTVVRSSSAVTRMDFLIMIRLEAAESERTPEENRLHQPDLRIACLPKWQQGVDRWSDTSEPTVGE